MLISDFQLAGDDGDLEVQQVIEEQIMAGQGGNQLTTQEFEDRFFCAELKLVSMTLMLIVRDICEFDSC